MKLFCEKIKASVIEKDFVNYINSKNNKIEW